LILLTLYSLAACGSTASKGGEEANRAEAGHQDDRGPVVTVSRVVDGDTIEITPAVDGLTEVRLIGVDTPETEDPRTGVQPYGEQAYCFTADTLEGEEVSLEFDVERTDRYGRLLAYVWLPDGRKFNEVLLEEGYAQVATFPPNVRYVERFEKAQREAREAGRGLWGLPEGQLCQQTDRGNSIGGGCGADSAAQEPPSPSGSSGSGRAGDLDCSDFSAQEEAQKVLDKDPATPTASMAATGMGQLVRAFPSLIRDVVIPPTSQGAVMHLDASSKIQNGLSCTWVAS
jgi:micrococcal nuclease